jgi:transcription elongation factor B polypeptide 3
MLHCLGKLFHLPVTVQHLQDTGVGRTVNALRKYEGDTGEAAKALVAKWKAMVAAEDSSEGERESHPEENSLPEEERHNHRHDEYHRSNRENMSHHRADSKKHKEEERLVKLKKMSSQGKKRRREEENREILEKRRRKDETDSESSGCGNSLQAVGQEDNDSEHDSEPRSTSQVSQNVVDNSSDDGAQSPCVQSHNNKCYDSHRKHEKHKVTNSSNKEKVENKQKGDRISSSHEGIKRTENKNVNESKQRKDFKRKVEVRVSNKEHYHNDTSKKHKSKTGSRANNIPDMSESPSKPLKLDKTSAKIKKANLSAKEEEDGSIDCSTGMHLS